MPLVLYPKLYNVKTNEDIPNNATYSYLLSQYDALVLYANIQLGPYFTLEELYRWLMPFRKAILNQGDISFAHTALAEGFSAIDIESQKQCGCISNT